MEDIKIRKAEKADIEKIISYIKKFMLDDENLLPEQVVIAEIKGNIAGFGRIKPYQNLYELSTIGVLEEYREKGVGKKIIKHLLEIVPTEEIWITTKIPEYFSKFGFIEDNNPPNEILEKCKRICLSAYKTTDDSYFMVLRSNKD